MSTPTYFALAVLAMLAAAGVALAIDAWMDRRFFAELDEAMQRDELDGDDSADRLGGGAA